jgi:hypothetical protein
MIREYGPQTFRKTAIWDVDWTEMGRRMGYDVNGELADPRSPFERAVHRWLQKTQPNMLNPLVRLIQKSLQLAGW